MVETEPGSSVDIGETSNINKFLESVSQYKERFNALCTEFDIEQLLQEIRDDNNPEAAEAKSALDQAAKEFLDTLTTTTIKDGELQGSAKLGASTIRESFTKALMILESTPAMNEYGEKIATIEQVLKNAGV